MKDEDQTQKQLINEWPGLRQQTAELKASDAKTKKSRRASKSIHYQLFESTADAIMLLDEKGFFDCNNATLAQLSAQD